MASPPADRRDQPARAAAIAAAERRLRRGFGAVRRLATTAPSDNVDESADDPTLAQFCLLDPRVGAGTDDPAFDLHDDYDSAAEAGDVLPAGETTCIINADFQTTGSDEGSSVVAPVYFLFNLNDGFRTFK